MRKAIILLAVLLGLTGRAFAAEELVDTGAIEAALPQEARELLGAEEEPDLGRILSGAVERSGGALKTALYCAADGIAPRSGGQRLGHGPGRCAGHWKYLPGEHLRLFLHRSQDG